MRTDWSGDLYGSVLVDSGSAVSADLLLDDSQQHVYVLTSSRVRESSPHPWFIIISVYFSVSVSVCLSLLLHVCPRLSFCLLVLW